MSNAVDAPSPSASAGPTVASEPISDPQKIDDLRQRLTELAKDIQHWRGEVHALRAAKNRPDAATDNGLLVSMEETSGAIYRAIADFDELIRDVDRKSHVAAGQIAEVGDAL